jgi:succinate-acetate transporter protein
MKKITKTLLVILFLLLTAKTVKAEDVQTCTQVTQYGGAVGIVCGVHTPVDTGLADINPVALASLFFGMSGYGIYQYKKLQKTNISLN